MRSQCLVDEKLEIWVRMSGESAVSAGACIDPAKGALANYYLPALDRMRYKMVLRRHVAVGICPVLPLTPVW